MNARVIFTTERGTFHQEMARADAPPVVRVVMLRQPDTATLHKALQHADYWISERVGTITAADLDAAPNLKLIQRLGRWTHDIDLQAAHERGIIVCATPVDGAIAVAEHLMLQTLYLLKRVPQTTRALLSRASQHTASKRTDEDTFRFNWTQQRDLRGLHGATVGIMGFGEIGTELALRLRGWDCRVVYHKRRQLPQTVERQWGIEYADPATLYRQSDVLVNLLPYTPDTEGLLNADVFAQLPRGAIVVSAGSGSVIDETALADAVRSKQLSGAALDTYEYEPIQADNPLLALQQDGHNVLLTPHIAGLGGTVGRLHDYANLLYHMAGQPVTHQIHPE
jgi:phosphoglycerate dehydrogenase-like enzyme